MRRTDEEIEQSTKKLRDFLGIAAQLRPDIMTLIVKLKNLYPGFGYLRVPVIEMANAAASFDAEKMLLRIREDTFQAMQRGEARARFTIIHEIAHFFLNHKGIRNRSDKKLAYEKGVPRISRDESEADRFAAAFLAPEELLLNDDVENTFGLSKKASEIRLETIQRMRRRRTGESRKLPQGVVDFLREGERRGLKPKTPLK